MDEAQLASLKAKYGTVFEIKIPASDYDDAVSVFVKRVPKADWKRFRSMASDDAQRADALETLTWACVVYPDAAGFGAMLEERPGLAEKIGGKLVDMAGGEKSAEVKKR